VGDFIPIFNGKSSLNLKENQEFPLLFWRSSREPVSIPRTMSINISKLLVAVRLVRKLLHDFSSLSLVILAFLGTLSLPPAKALFILAIGFNLWLNFAHIGEATNGSKLIPTMGNIVSTCGNLFRQAKALVCLVFCAHTSSNNGTFHVPWLRKQPNCYPFDIKKHKVPVQQPRLVSTK
jgi:hypothetical protein